ncbi:hypothetical protein DA075_12230 [Methylobacterium currus]|uniref:Uncharacterized protein n=2 Tax=Methylobacterium currus TaxID=2051553 RepID=A0A2R4WJ76_9HYPH|nr:hypothetical protein DA075_12230 [Methylobacterium currus]
MHDRPGGPAPAILAPVRPTGDVDRMAAVLAPGLRAAFDGCLAEALPANLADLLGRLDHPGGAHKPGSSLPGSSPQDRDAAARCSRTPDSFKRS